MLKLDGSERKRIPKQKKGKLTPYKRHFIAEYLKDGLYNGTQALRRVGYKGTRPGERAFQLLHLSEVAQEIERQLDTRLKSIGVNSERILTELARIGLSDIGKVVNKDGSPKDIEELDEQTRAAISSIETYHEYAGKGENRIQIGVTRKVKLWDKLRALETLAKHLKIVGSEEVQSKEREVVIIERTLIVKPDNSGLSEE